MANLTIAYHVSISLILNYPEIPDSCGFTQFIIFINLLYMVIDSSDIKSIYVIHHFLR